MGRGASSADESEKTRNAAESISGAITKTRVLVSENIRLSVNIDRERKNKHI
jgi:hypothetical protein